VSILYRNVMLYEIGRERPQPKYIEFLSQLEHGTALHCTRTLRFDLRLQVTGCSGVGEPDDRKFFTVVRTVVGPQRTVVDPEVDPQ
jgi:hypothetical protein